MAIFNFDSAYGRPQVNNEGTVLIPGIGDNVLLFQSQTGNVLTFTVNDPGNLATLEVTFTPGVGDAITITKIQALNAGGAIGMTAEQLSIPTNLTAAKAVTTGWSYTTTGNDRFDGTDLNDILRAGDGDDVLLGYNGNDQMFGGNGDDLLFGGTGTNTVDGGDGYDVLHLEGARGAFTFTDLGGGKVSISGGGQTTTIENTEEIGFVVSPDLTYYRSISSILAGSDFPYDPPLPPVEPPVKPVNFTGTNGNNSLVGNELNNQMKGLGGNDKIYGQAGKDKIWGGLGNDYLSGGLGGDVFVFDTKANARTNVDKIIDFNRVADQFQIQNSVFTKVGSHGKLKADAFFKGKSAGDAEDRVIYDQKTGNVFYDADGKGGVAQVKIGVIVNKASMTHLDWDII